MRKRAIIITLIVCSSVCGADDVDRAGWGRSGREIVVRATLEVIPADVRSLFQRRQDELLERCIEPELVWPQNPQLSDRGGWHYVDLDVAATSDSIEARLAAAQDFPRHQTALRRFFTRNGGQVGGVLPWTLIQQYDDLVEVFATGTEDDVIRLSGYVMHFCGDAASPFAVSYDAAGSRIGLPGADGVSPSNLMYAHRSSASRILGELVRRNRVRYAGMIDLSSADYAPVEDPRDRVFSVLTESLRELNTALQLDRNVAQTMKLETVGQLVAREEQYYRLLDELGGPYCMGRLRRASLLAGNLIGGAWQAAGEPTLQEIRARSAAAPKRDKKIPQTGAYVGSRHSNVFHNLDCRFAKNISPDNLVYFKSPLEARRQGRRQCRTCKPE